VKGIDTTVLDTFAVERSRWSDAPHPEGRRGWPVVRLNALPAVQTPSLCRRVVCQIGGYAEVRDPVEQGGANRSLSSTASPTTTKGVAADFARERAVKRLTDSSTI
jgi:hypothetical protein